METKPLLMGVLIVLAAVLVFQIGNVITGYATQNETIPANVSVSNQAPTVSNLVCSDLWATNTFCANDTVVCTATVHDDNGWTDIDMSTTTGKFYLGTTGPACSADPNNCYVNTSCVNTSCSGLECTVQCTFNDVRYYILPGTWAFNLSIDDKNSANGNGANTSVQTIPQNFGLNVDNRLDFGSAAPGASTSEVTFAVDNCGNYGLDIYLNGTDYTNTSTVNAGVLQTVLVGNATYSTTSGSGYTSLTSTPTCVDMNITKATTDAGSSKNTYWVFNIPTNTEGEYEGTITFGASINSSC